MMIMNRNEKRYVEIVESFADVLAERLNIDVVIETNTNAVEQTTVNVSVIHK